MGRLVSQLELAMRARVALLILLVGIVCVSATTPKPAAKTPAAKTPATKTAAKPAAKHIPTKKLPGVKKQYQQLIPGSAKGYPDKTDYVTQRVLPAAVVGFLFAFLSLLIGILFCCVHTCAAMCTCCSNGCATCCGTGPPPEEGYTSCQKL